MSLNLDAYPEWHDLVATLRDAEGVIALVGATDRGKTTLCSLLTNALLERGQPVPVVDADIGQSEIGPSGTICMGVATKPLARIGELTPKAMSFVGTTSPGRHPTACVAGAGRMVDLARATGAPTILLDTTGFVFGGPARYLKLTKLDLIMPSHVVTLQRDGELYTLVAALRARETWQVHTAPVPAAITHKPPSMRVQRRNARLMVYFKDARAHELSLDGVSLIGSRLGSGDPLPPPSLKFAEAICRAPVFTAEQCGDYLTIVTPATLSEQQIGELEQRFHVHKIAALDPSAWAGLFVGLTDGFGHTFAAGIIRKVDFRARMIHLVAPIQSVAPVRWVHLGIMRLRPDGHEMGETRPWQA